MEWSSDSIKNILSLADVEDVVREHCRRISLMITDACKEEIRHRDMLSRTSIKTILEMEQQRQNEGIAPETFDSSEILAIDEVVLARYLAAVVSFSRQVAAG